MRKVIFLAAVFSLIPLSIQAVETVNSVYFEGAAPIVVDGDLSDWAFVNTGPVPITNAMLNWWNKRSNTIIPIKSQEDLSGSFQCFYDSYNLYAAVKVTDDKFMSGREPFNFNFFDDCVEISFNGDSDKWFQEGNYGLMRVFADDKTGKSYIEMGGLSPPWEKYPYIWEELGVKAVLKQNDQGYTVEAAIPTHILGWNEFKQNRQIGLNIKINDFDGNTDKDCALIWGKDSTKKENQWHNLMSFTTSVSQPKESQPVSDSAGSGKNIVAVLGNPDEIQSFDAVKEIYRVYSQQDYAETERLLNLSSNNGYWKKYFLGNIRFNTKNYNESGDILLQNAREFPDACIARKELYQSGRAFMRAGDKMKALDIFGEVLLSTVERNGSLEFVIYEIIRESIEEIMRNEHLDSPVSIKGNDIMCNYVQSYMRSMNDSDVSNSNYLRLVELGLVRVKAYDASILLLEKILHSNNDKEIIQHTKSELAWIYFDKGDFDKSKQVSDEQYRENQNEKQQQRNNSISYQIDVKKYFESNKAFDYKALSGNCKEHYKSQVVLGLSFGKGIDHVGLISDIQQGSLGGVSGFAVDNKNNIYILDAGNYYIKIYNSFGKLINYFSIADNCYGSGTMSLDESNNIWIHNWNINTLNVYNCENGELLKTIIYDKDIIPEFSFRDKALVGRNDRIDISNESHEKGIYGEPLFRAKVFELDQTKPSVWNSGKHTKKLYNFPMEYYPENKKELKKPKLLISDGAITSEVFYDKIEPIYEDYRILGEDTSGCYYIFFYTKYKNLRQHIYKYDAKNNLVAIINDINCPIGYFIREPVVVSDSGDVYVMNTSDKYIKIIKWSK
ncbi:MAG: sugar-binding protein [Candidatus Latescibacterota bacterium]